MQIIHHIANGARARSRRRNNLGLIALCGALLITTGDAAAAPAWQPVDRSHLQVTDGAISAAGSQTTPRTRSAGMRAVERDRGHHATQARLRCTYRNNGQTTKPLGSGEIRRQIGLKLDAADPCNLVYVMWRAYPDVAITVFLKRNPGQHTSAECHNRGYTDVATIRLSGPTASVRRPHVLETHTRRTADGSLALSVYTDGALIDQERLDAALTSGMDGPIGLRSDNGNYAFRLSARRRS